MKHYNRVYNPLIRQESEWLIICDIDEYFFGVNEKLSDYVRKVNETDTQCIKSNWLRFGSSNLDMQPECIRTSFLYRDPAIQTSYNKSIMRTSTCRGLGIHNHSMLDKEKFILDNENIHLNHYQVMSKEYYEKIKMTRGGADGFPTKEECDTWRSWNWFNLRNRNEYQDNTLKDILENNLY
jgi:hypothetical protein